MVLPSKRYWLVAQRVVLNINLDFFFQIEFTATPKHVLKALKISFFFFLHFLKCLSQNYEAVP